MAFFQLNVSLYGRLFNDSGSSIICETSLQLLLLRFEWPEAQKIPKKNVERFHHCHRFWGTCYFGKEIEKNSWDIIIKKIFRFTHGRGEIKILFIAAQ